MNIRVRTTSSSAKPASASAPLDDRERRARLARGVAGVARARRRAGVGGAADEARVADRERPRVAGGRLPRAAAGDAPPGHAAGAARLAHAARRSARQARTSGSRPIASDQRGEQRGPGHDRGDLQVLARRVVQAADRAQAVDASARPCPAVVFASEAPPVAASWSSKPRPRRDRLRVPDEPARPLQLLHRPVARLPRLDVDGDVGDHGRWRRRRGWRPRPPSRASRVDRAHVDLHRALLGDDVRPRAAVDDPDVDGDARPAAVERVELGDDARRLEDRAAALLGLDAGVRRAAVDRDREPGDALARRRRCRRSPGRTRGRGRRRRRRRGARMCGVDAGEPISSSGLATKTRRASGSPPSTSRHRARCAYSPVSRPPFMSVTPGPVAMPSVDARRAARPRCPGRTPCPCGRCTAAAGPSGSPPGKSAMTVSPRPSSFGCVVDRRAEGSQPVRRSSARPRRRRPSCSCPQSMLTRRSRSARKAGSAAVDGGARRGQLGRGDEVGRGSAWPKSIERATAPGTHGPPRVSSPDRAPDRDPTARGPQRLPARAGGQGRGRGRAHAGLAGDRGPASDGVVHLGAQGAAPASGPTRSQTSSPGPAACAPTTASTADRARSIAAVRRRATGSSRGRGPAPSARA